MQTTRLALTVFVLVVLALFARDIFLGGPGPSVYETGPGEYTELTLPDGSEVMLNAATRLEVSTEFGTGRRVVRLQGQAAFDVSFDPRQPFVVETDRLDVIARATVFDVRGYREPSSPAVLVSEGVVEVRSAGRSTTLREGQRAVHSDDGLVVESGEASDQMAWQEGRLVFRSERMDVVAQQLERWYGVAVVLDDTVLSPLRLDASFEHDSVGAAAQEIADELGIDVNVSDRRISFRMPGR